MKPITYFWIIVAVLLIADASPAKAQEDPGFTRAHCIDFEVMSKSRQEEAIKQGVILRARNKLPGFVQCVEDHVKRARKAILKACSADFDRSVSVVYHLAVLRIKLTCEELPAPPDIIDFDEEDLPEPLPIEVPGLPS